jgi:hypothetical protein
MAGANPWGFTLTAVDEITDPDAEFRALSDALRIDRHEYGIVADALDRCHVFCDRAMVLETAARRHLQGVHAEHERAEVTWRKQVIHMLQKKRPTIDEIRLAIRLHFGEQVDDFETQEIIARGTVNRCKILSEQWQQRRHDLRVMLKRLS